MSLICRLGRSIVGRIKFENLSDGFIRDPYSYIGVGELVRVRVLR